MEDKKQRLKKVSIDNNTGKIQINKNYIE